MQESVICNAATSSTLQVTKDQRMYLEDLSREVNTHMEILQNDFERKDWGKLKEDLDKAFIREMLVKKGLPDKLPVKIASQVRPIKC